MKQFLQLAWAFAGLAVASFFGVGTYQAIHFGNLAEEKIPQYEELWSRGWDDFNSISGSIEELTDTTVPVVENLVQQVDEMNDTVRHMDSSVTYMAQTLPPQMSIMTDQMGRMQHNIKPKNMMRDMMPFP